MPKFIHFSKLFLPCYVVYSWCWWWRDTQQTLQLRLFSCTCLPSAPSTTFASLLTTTPPLPALLTPFVLPSHAPLEKNYNVGSNDASGCRNRNPGRPLLPLPLPVPMPPTPRLELPVAFLVVAVGLILRGGRRVDWC